MKGITLIILALAASMLQAQPYRTDEREVVFRDVTVIPMDNEKTLDNQTVVVKAGRITAIGNSKKVSYGRDALVIDARGKYLLPGLAEMHAHVPPVDDLAPMKEVLTLFAVNGITTIRGMLGHPKHLELRSMLRTGEIIGPNFYTTGPSFNGTSVTSPEGGAAMVRRQKNDGYDFLKLHPGLTRTEFDSIARVASAVGIPFVGHVSYGVGVWRAIEAGYSSIDHLDGFVEALVPGIEKIPEQEAGLFGMFVADRADQARIPELVRKLRAGNIWVVPTQSLAERWFHPDYKAEDFTKDPDAAYMATTMVEQWLASKNNLMKNPAYDPQKIRDFVALRRKLIKECQDGGVGLLLGCDAPQVFNVPGFSTHNELVYLVNAGLTPYQALRTGTVNVANYLNRKDAGVIREGAVAELILLNGNPLKDIRQTRNIEGVMVAGQWFPRPYIDSELSKLRK